MKTLIIVFLIMINIFAIILNWKMLKGFDISKKVIFIVIGEIVIFIVANILYGISGGGIPEAIHDKSKKLVIPTFLAINMIVIFSNFAKQINKKALDEIDYKTFKKRISIAIILSVIILFLECIYMKNIQLGILKYMV